MTGFVLRGSRTVLFNRWLNGSTRGIDVTYIHIVIPWGYTMLQDQTKERALKRAQDVFKGDGIDQRVFRLMLSLGIVTGVIVFVIMWGLVG